MRFLDRVRGRGFKARLRNPVDAWWDHRLGVNTFGYQPAVGHRDAPDFQVHYTPTHYRRLFRILRAMGLDGSSHFLDLGSGLGRAVFAAGILGARRAVGVEINEALHAGACANLDRFGGDRQGLAFHCGPAEEHPFAQETAIFMFHPFGPGTMERVIANLGASLGTTPRRISIAYENPINAAVLDAAPFLQRSGHWPAGAVPGSDYETLFWTG